MGTQRPANKENWLFIVARNDVLNQLKRKQKENRNSAVENLEERTATSNEKDLRLQTILFIAGVENSSNQAKILFVLKNIFGLSIKEISDCTLLHHEAIYKSISRTKKSV